METILEGGMEEDDCNSLAKDAKARRLGSGSGDENRVRARVFKGRAESLAWGQT